MVWKILGIILQLSLTMKNVRGKKTCGEGSKTSNLGSIEFSIPPMQHLFLGLSCLWLQCV